jgi:predicted porin
MRGVEDLGGGLSAVFRLENGFNVNTGKLSQGGLEFGRQAYVGLSHSSFGTMTVGRQPDASLDIWSPYTAAGSTIGDFADHPLDNDNADFFVRYNNVVKYISSVMNGLQVEATYALSNSTNFADNREYSLAANYKFGNVAGAASYPRSSNPSSSTNPNGAVSATNAFGFLGSLTQNIDAGLRWTFSGASNIAVAYSHVDVYATPGGTIENLNVGVNATGQNSWKFDNAEVNGQYFFTPALSLAAAYTFTHAGVNAAQYSSATWHQGSLMLNYSLSKRTAVYVMGAYVHSNQIAAKQFGVNTAGLGRSSSENQSLARVGIITKF